MRVEKGDGKIEKRIVTAMIVDTSVLARVVPKWSQRDDHYKSRQANLIGSWCVKYYNKYGKAPGKSIESMYESWASGSKNAELVKLIDKYLAGLSTEYENLQHESNSDAVVDMAEEHFNKVAISKLAEQLTGDVDQNQLVQARERIDTFDQISLTAKHGIDILQDEEAIGRAFDQSADCLFQYPGALGKFIGSAFSRDRFLALMGPEKRGKSQWLIDIAWRALLHRRRVAFFEVGDMSEADVLMRILTRAARHPQDSEEMSYPIEISRESESPIADVRFKKKDFAKGLNRQMALKAAEKVMRKRVKSKESYFKLFVHPNSSINVKGIESELAYWARTGWTADVVLIDYADILAPPAGVADTRDQINLSWKQMRALSQSNHCCVVTATQADAASYGVELLSMKNFSEDKRKYGHVNGMLGLNQTEEEKEMGLTRLNWLVRREKKFSSNRCVHVAGNASIADPAILSCF